VTSAKIFYYDAKKNRTILPADALFCSSASRITTIQLARHDRHRPRCMLLAKIAGVSGRRIL